MTVKGSTHSQTNRKRTTKTCVQKIIDSDNVLYPTIIITLTKPQRHQDASIRILLKIKI